MENYRELYELWLERADADADLRQELLSVAEDDEAIRDRFWRSLEFGTGGLRGVIGAGTNRMNIYTVAQATQGLADYLNAHFSEPSVAIGFDSRIKSDVFAKAAASTLAANGIRVYMYADLKPTPMLSFAVRRLGCASGIVITASHNPSKYNGYKCYDSRGYQMTDDAARETLECIKKLDIFNDVKTMDFEDALAEDMVDFIEEWLEREYFDSVLKAQVEPDAVADSGLKIIYTPLNGTGNRPVRHIFKRMGLKDVMVVESQEKPDGSFPTCPFPNPEIRQVFEEALKLTEAYKADLIIATDPDADRVGIAVADEGEYKLMTGNEVACLLTDYILSRKKAQGRLPERPVVVKTIVTSPLVKAISDEFSGELYDLLTGFKYIGELITQLEEKGEAERFVIGMEESYGYLSGTHVREKDAVVAAMLIAEMAAFYKKEGKNLYARMQELYEKHGMYLNTLLNFNFEGADGMQKMLDMMSSLRQTAPDSVGGLRVLSVADYLGRKKTDCATGTQSEISLPSSNVIGLELEGGSCVIVRPSGTEPKIKIYLTAHCADRPRAEALTESLAHDIEKILGI